MENGHWSNQNRSSKAFFVSHVWWRVSTRSFILLCFEIRISFIILCQCYHSKCHLIKQKASYWQIFRWRFMTWEQVLQLLWVRARHAKCLFCNVAFDFVFSLLGNILPLAYLLGYTNDQMNKNIPLIFNMKNTAQK